MGGGSVCPGPGFPGVGTSLTPVSVTAKVVDENGAPVAGQPVYICGTNICSSPGTTGPDGSVVLHNDAGHQTDPAFKFGDTLAYAEMAVSISMPTTDLTAGGMKLVATGKLSDKPAAALVPGGSATSGDVTVTLAPGTVPGYDGIIYDTADARKLRTVTIPLDNLAQVFAPLMINGMPADFSLVYGVRPAETLLCPAGKITVALPHKNMMPNDLGWAAGTMVEFWIMTTDTLQQYAPYGSWTKESDGVVSADGTTVSTVDGGGFLLLENFAIRKSSP
jgi:hypothetical protein